MLSKKKLLSKGLLVVLFAVLLISGLGVILRSAHAAPSVTPIYNYTGPTLRLPWLYGSYPISQSYNCTDHTTGTKDQFAIDFGFGSGNQVQLTAVFAGTIHYGTYDSGGYGNSLWITNGNWKAVYAHLGTSQTDNGILVANNKPVVQGQKIAMSGWTGWVSPAGPAGAHLHFSLRYKTSELTNQYDGDPVRPEPMSGYGIGGNGVSFGDYGKCGTRGNGLFNPGPGGFWIGPTPRGKYTDTNGVIHYNPIRAGTLVNLGFQAHDNNNRGLQYVHFTKSQDNGNTWSILPIDSTKNVSNGDVQYFAHFTMPNVPVILSADVGSKNGSFQLAPNGLRYFCLSNTKCPTELIVYNGPDGKGYGGGGGTPPPPTEGVTVCQNTNYASPCETFHYTTDDVCISLDQMSGYNKSVQDINNAY